MSEDPGLVATALREMVRSWYKPAVIADEMGPEIKAVTPEQHQALIGGKPLDSMSVGELRAEIASICNEGASFNHRHVSPSKLTRLEYVRRLIAERSTGCIPADATSEQIGRITDFVASAGGDPIDWQDVAALIDGRRHWMIEANILDNRPPLSAVQGACGHIWIPVDHRSMGPCEQCQLISDRQVLVDAIRSTAGSIGTDCMPLLVSAMARIGEVIE